MYNFIGDVALTNISRETKYLREIICFSLSFGYVLSMFLNLGHFPASRSDRKRFYFFLKSAVNSLYTRTAVVQYYSEQSLHAYSCTTTAFHAYSCSTTSEQIKQSRREKYEEYFLK